MIKANNIYLIGPVGAGKTAVGKRLAQERGLAFYDTDQEIETRTGADVSWIFDIEGAPGLLKREEKIITELTSLKNVVLATGGSAVVSPLNRMLLAERGLVVYLQVSRNKQLLRLSKDHASALEELQTQHDALYQELADFVFDTDFLNTPLLAQKILWLLEEKPPIFDYP